MHLCQFQFWDKTCLHNHLYNFMEKKKKKHIFTKTCPLKALKSVCTCVHYIPCGEVLHNSLKIELWSSLIKSEGISKWKESFLSVESRQRQSGDRNPSAMQMRMSNTFYTQLCEHSNQNVQIKQYGFLKKICHLSFLVKTFHVAVGSYSEAHPPLLNLDHKKNSSTVSFW